LGRPGRPKVGIDSSTLTAFAVGFALACAVCSAAGFFYLRHLGLNVRFRPVAEMDDLQHLRPQPVGSPSSQQAFLALLQRAGFPPGSVRDVASAIRLQTWLGNQLSQVAVYSGPERGYDLLRYGMQGGGVACGSVSDMFREAMVLLGVPSRSVELSQSDFRQRTHAVVEAQLEGGWRVLDPTFNATYEGPGGALGVEDIQHALAAGTQEIRAVWHGPRRFAADFEPHARVWQLYFANAYVYETGGTPQFWRRLPPWRYWTGPARFYYGDHPMALPGVQDRLYWMTAFLLPVAALLATLAAVAVGALTARH
jgi:hypothetical protein